MPLKKNDMKVFAIIPSRYESTRFGGKPLERIGGKPMVLWVYERVRQAVWITDVAVATDDQRILSTVRRFGGRAVMTSKENRSGTDRVAEAADIIGLDDHDIVINVQGDQPTIDPRCLDEVVEPFWANPELEMSTLAFKIVNKDEITNPKDVKVTFDRNGFALYFSRSPIPCGRDPSDCFDTYKHLGVYAYTKRFLDIFKRLPEGRLERIEKLEQLRALEHGHRIMVKITAYDSPEVDEPEDISRIEKIIGKKGE